MSLLLVSAGFCAPGGAEQRVLDNPTGSGYSLIVKSLILQSESFGRPRVYIVRASLPGSEPLVWSRELPASVPCNVVDEVLHLEPGDSLWINSSTPTYTPSDQLGNLPPLNYRCSYVQVNNLRHKLYLLNCLTGGSAQTPSVPVGESWIVESVAYKYFGGFFGFDPAYPPIFSIAGPQQKPISNSLLSDCGTFNTSHLLDRGLPLMPGESLEIQIGSTEFVSQLTALVSVTELPPTSLIGQYKTAFYQQALSGSEEDAFTAPPGKTVVVQGIYARIGSFNLTLGVAKGNTYFPLLFSAQPRFGGLNEGFLNSPNLLFFPVHLEPGDRIQMADASYGTLQVLTISYMEQA